MKHNHDKDCPCGPDVETLMSDGGVVGDIYIHHEPIVPVRIVVETRLIPPMAMRLTGCEADWVDDVWAGRRHVHRERS